MTTETHKHCSSCSAPYSGPREVCDACALAEYDEISKEAASDHHEPEAEYDHEPEHEAEAEAS